MQDIKGLHTNYKKLGNVLVLFFIISICLFYFFHSRQQMGCLNDFYLKNKVENASGFFAVSRVDNIVSTQIDKSIDFTNQANTRLAEGHYNKTVWRAAFLSEATAVYSLSAVSKGSALVYVDSLLRLNLYQDGALKHKKRNLVLKKGYHTIRIVYRGNKNVEEPVLSVNLRRLGFNKKPVEFLPVDVSGKLDQEYLFEDSCGQERSSLKFSLIMLFLFTYCLVFRRYFNYGFEMIFLFVLSMGYVFPDLNFLSYDESKSILEALARGSVSSVEGVDFQHNIFFYKYLDAVCSFFSYRIEGVRFALALSGAVTAVFMLKVFVILFDVEKKNTLLFMQPVLWFSFFVIVSFMRFSAGITSLNSTLFMFILYIYLKAHNMHSKGYDVLLFYISGLLLGFVVADNMTEISFLITFFLVSLIMTKISLLQTLMLMLGFFTVVIFNLSCFKHHFIDSSVINTSVFFSFDSFLSSFCGCFSLDFLFKGVEKIYLINAFVFVIAFLLFVVSRYTVKRKYCRPLIFCFLVMLFLTTSRMFFSDHHNCNCLYIPLLFLLLMFSGMFYELIFSGRKYIARTAYALFAVLLLLNVASMFKYFSVNSKEKILSRAAVCSETPLYLDQMHKLYLLLQKYDITCVIADDMIVSSLIYMDLPYGHFKIFTKDEYEKAIHNEHCKKLRKVFVTISGEDNRHLISSENYSAEGGKFLRISLKG